MIYGTTANMYVCVFIYTHKKRVLKKCSSKKKGSKEEKHLLTEIAILTVFPMYLELGQ